jgi:hypothetical protein
MHKVLKVYNPMAVDYDTYDSFVVIVEEGELKEIEELLLNVKGYINYEGIKKHTDQWDNDPNEWIITYVGLTEEPVQVVLGSYNAG